MKLGLLFFLLFIIKTQFAIAQCWKSISVGFMHSVAIKEDGTLWAWGGSPWGQIGDSTLNGTLVPKQIGTNNNWSKVSAGGAFNVALKTDGTIWSWGLNSSGQLGIGSSSSTILVPTQMGTENDWLDVKAGFAFATALKSDGTLWAWGSNNFGQLGDGTYNDRSNPGLVSTDTDWESIGIGDWYSLCVRNQGTLMAWGANNDGQLGNGTTTESNVPLNIETASWMEIKGGGGHSGALKYTGPDQTSLWLWGNNDQGQLGNGNNISQSLPTQVGIDDDWVKLACNDQSTYALKLNGTLWAWGENDYGQLGDGTNLARSTPVQIGSGGWQSIADGSGNHMIASKTDGSLWAWGKNIFGQLGDGTSDNSSIPKLIMPCNLGIVSLSNQNISLFPNPTSDFLNIRGAEELKIDEIYITDVNGKRIGNSYTNLEKINVQHLASGFYILNIQFKNQFIHLKFIKN